MPVGEIAMIKPVKVDSALGDATARHIVPLSGGKDSTALAIHMSETYPEVQFEYVFSDTGAELPETYAYLDRLDHVLDRPVTRVSALEILHVKDKPGRTAFDVVLFEHFAGFLPSPRSRWCTRMLKIHPFEHHVGSDRAYSYIGIRADEHRKGYTGTGSKPVVLSVKPNITPVYPFKDIGYMKSDIQRILEESGLGLPDYYSWRSRSGCYFCFYQQIAEWQNLKQHHPDLFERAKGYEQQQDGRGYTWVDGRSLEQIASMPRRSIQAKADERGCAICHL